MTALDKLTTQDSLEGFLTSQGVFSFSAGDDDTVARCIDYATAYIWGRIGSKFKIELLVDCDLLEECANVIAGRSLCTRRGNPIPESLELRYQEIVNLADGILFLISTNKLKLFNSDGVAIQGRGSSAPAMANLVVDRRYPTEQIRVREGSSTNAQSKLERDAAFQNGVSE